MRRTLTWRLGLIIIGVIVATVIINSITTYNTAYDSLYQAAGAEAYGCANITTGLLNEQDIEDLQNGNRSHEIGKKLNWTIDHKSIFEDHYILSLDGEILALDDNLKEQGFAIGDEFRMDEEAVQTLKDKKHSTYSEIYEFGGMERISGYAPIFKDHDSSKEIVAISVIDFDADIVAERTWDVVKEGIIIGFIPLLIAAVVTLFLIRKKTKPISTLIERTRMIANGDITEKNMNIKSKDEVGDLANNLNEMSANLRQVITTIKATSDDLVENADYTSSSMNEMKLALEHVSSNMEEVAAGTSDGAEMTTETSESLVDLAKLIQSSSEKADTSVNSAEYTMEAAKNGKQKVEEIEERMKAIKTSSTESKQKIEYLNAYTTEIQKITETITGIADQTNLLALNAAIEAARAGEHGKGFAVVADEIRKLAEQSNKEASSVGKVIAKITANISETVESMEGSHQHVEAGVQTVNETGEVLENIRNAVSNIAEEISSLTALIHDEASTSEQIVHHVKQLEKAHENMAASAQGVSAATEESTASAEEVANRSSKLADIAKQLNMIVNKFKL
ncbi:methyl-accepting chemotaxis protein [Oceanobacillus halophilus]|uniref:Methyl-accepting chemotaxis protein n=1 Tax=Oceanobacillus halophilus TaxID=930130 RepID=A0A495A4W3_9BACI|nr:HAMP domain-containing methyl-accepting chemotaxis protein [Oceanobacillus halophilus]RKQ34593.1 methyl-accepting chemotaxis protein [Oceanobacillus halophilus]